MKKIALLGILALLVGCQTPQAPIPPQDHPEIIKDGATINMSVDGKWEVEFAFKLSAPHHRLIATVNRAFHRRVPLSEKIGDKAVFFTDGISVELRVSFDRTGQYSLGTHPAEVRIDHQDRFQRNKEIARFWVVNQQLYRTLPDTIQAHAFLVNTQTAVVGAPIKD